MRDIETVLKNWNLSSYSMEKIYSSAWAIGTDYILKFGNHINSAERNLAIIKSLSALEIPVAKVIPTNNGDDLLILDNSYYLLTKRINGDHIRNIYEEDYISISRKCGELIAKLHLAFLKIEGNLDCWDNSLLNEMNGWIKDSFNKMGYSLISKDAFYYTIHKLTHINQELPVQLIHRDIHLGNLLFENGEVSGYIDFDLSQKNIRIFDLCYFALSLLVGNIDNDKETEKWYLILKNLVMGYESISHVTDQEKQAMGCVMECIEILFTAYFMEKGNYVLSQGAADMFHWIGANYKKIEDCIYGIDVDLI